MIKKRVLVGFIMILSLLMAPGTEGYAAEAQSKTAVVYRVPEGTPFPFILEVQGNGTVYDGTKAIRNGSVQYEMVEGQQKELRVVPDEGFVITHIYCKTTSLQDIRDQLKGDQLTVTVPNSRVLLTFVFEKIPEKELGTAGDRGPGGPGKPPADKDKAKGTRAGRTGDETSILGYLLIAGLSGMVLLAAGRRKRQLSQV